MKAKSKIKSVKANRIGAVQGDVPIIKIDRLTVGGKIVKNRIVAVGESTGHNHRVVGDAICYELPDRWEFAIGANGAQLVHTSGGDHRPIELAPLSLYAIPRDHQQVEYDGADERRVSD